MIYFGDLDGVEQLTFEATVSDASVVSAVVNGTSLYITNAMTVSGTSSATVTVTASDPDASVSDTFTATFVFTAELAWYDVPSTYSTLLIEDGTWKRSYTIEFHKEQNNVLCWKVTQNT